MPESALGQQRLATVEQRVAVTDAQLQSLMRELAEFGGMVRRFNEDQVAIHKMLVRLIATQGELKEDTGRLLAVVCEGNNGRPSLVERVQTCETAASSTARRLVVLSRGLRGSRLAVARVAKSKMLTRGQLVVGFLGMVTTALLALGAILAQMWRN